MHPKALLLYIAAQGWLLSCGIGHAGLLFCEEGLDVEEAGLCGGSEGDCSPRCFEDLGDDSLSMSASTSDSQHSEGAPALSIDRPASAFGLVRASSEFPPQVLTLFCTSLLSL